MSGSSVQILAQAHAYIEAGNLEDAENLIRSLLEQEPENTDAWWLLAHSVRDSAAARAALDQVLRLDPNDQQARSLLSALDDRFPDETGVGSGRRIRMPGIRLPGARMPAFRIPGGYDDFSTPVSYLVLLTLVIVGGWLLLRYFGFELNLSTPTPATPDSSVAQVAETDSPGLTVAADQTATAEAAATGFGAGQAGGAGTDGETDTPVPPEGSDSSVVGQAAGEVGAAGSADSATGQQDTGPTPAPVTPAVAPSGTEGDGARVNEAPDPAAVASTPLPTITPEAVPTYPFPAQTDPEEFAGQYLAAFAEAGLQLTANTPLLEASPFGSTALAGVCLRNTVGLRGTIDEAMEVMAGFALQLRDSAPALGVKVLDCDNNGNVLRVIAAPVDKALEWSEGALTYVEFQATWEAVG